MSDTCGFQSFCGRPAGHRGHHGGWRTGIAAPSSPHPVIRDWWRSTKLGTELTGRNLQVIAERIYHGDVAEAAACLGIAEQTVKNHISYALARTGAVSTIQVSLLLGWTAIPPGVLNPHAEVAS